MINIKNKRQELQERKLEAKEKMRGDYSRMNLRLAKEVIALSEELINKTKI